MDMVKKVSDPERTILINAGNNANYYSLIDEDEFKIIIKAMDLNQYDAIGLGVWDAKMGLDAVHEVAARTVTNFVCANVKGFVPYLRLEKDSGRLKVLVTSVIDSQLIQTFKIKDAVVSDPIKAVNAIVRKIKHDVFILIVHAQGERIHEIIAGCGTQADLIIDGETGRVENKISRIAGRPVVRNNFGGRHISYIDLLREKPGVRLSVKQPKLTKVELEKVARDPEADLLEAQYEKIRREYLIAHGAKINSQVAKKRKSFNMYLGAYWCGGCHQTILDNWRKTRHAGAIKILEKKQRLNDPACLVCHVTGMDDTDAIGGFISMEKDEGKANVQCEACHGPGGRHIQAPKKVRMLKGTRKTCLKCHTHDTDPTFSYQHDFSILNHGKNEPEKSK